MMIDPLILGHNQFIGVDHFSQDRARDRVQLFSETQKIIDIVTTFHKLGGSGMMLSTHPKIKQILNAIKSDSYLSKNINFYPLIPYAQGYVRSANEKGLLGMLNDALAPASFGSKLKISLSAGINLLKKDVINLIPTMIDVEMLQFKQLNTKAVILHNVVTDLALAFEARDIFELYIDYIDDNYGITPGFGTMNFTRLVKSFDEWGIKNPLILASFNKQGYQMNPSREDCERSLREYSVNLIAMSTLASGYLKPQEAYEYLFSLPNIRSVVVGVSSRGHAEETFGLIKEYMGKQEL
jgi:hypothetical protein